MVAEPYAFLDRGQRSISGSCCFLRPFVWLWPFVWSSGVFSRSVVGRRLLTASDALVDLSLLNREREGIPGSTLGGSGGYLDRTRVVTHDGQTPADDKEDRLSCGVSSARGFCASGPGSAGVGDSELLPLWALSDFCPSKSKSLPTRNFLRRGYNNCTPPTPPPIPYRANPAPNHAHRVTSSPATACDMPIPDGWARGLCEVQRSVLSLSRNGPKIAWCISVPRPPTPS